MTNERNTLPDARAVALVEMACDLARSEPDLAAFGKANADAFKALDPPTLVAVRTAYARRLQALRNQK